MLYNIINNQRYKINKKILKKIKLKYIIYDRCYIREFKL